MKCEEKLSFSIEEALFQFLFQSLVTDPLRETEARASGVPFLLDLPRRVFERISFRRLAILLSALGYASRNRLSLLPNLDKALDSVL